MVDFGYCLDCNELNYAITSKNGVYEKNKVADNHFGCNVHIFDTPNRYEAPIRQVLSKLQALLPISHNEIILFKLALSLKEW